MIRPYFGYRATLDIPTADAAPSFKAYALGNTLFVETEMPQPIQVFNAIGRVVYNQMGTSIQLSNLPRGLYLVKVGAQTAKKVIVN
jgi:hypothetical protein